MLHECTFVQIIFDWILANLNLVIPVGIEVIGFILLLIFKRHPKIIDNSVVSKLCVLIDSAEKKYGNGNGDKKLQFVLDEFIKLYPEYVDFRSQLKARIEYILSLPERK